MRYIDQCVGWLRWHWCEQVNWLDRPPFSRSVMSAVTQLTETPVNHYSVCEIGKQRTNRGFWPPLFGFLGSLNAQLNCGASITRHSTCKNVQIESLTQLNYLLVNLITRYVILHRPSLLTSTQAVVTQRS